MKRVYLVQLFLILHCCLLAQNWQQKGGDIDGDLDQDYSVLIDYFGTYSDMSSDGNAIAFSSSKWFSDIFRGISRVYIWTGSTWVKRGSDIRGFGIQINDDASLAITYADYYIWVPDPGSLFGGHMENQTVLCIHRFKSGDWQCEAEILSKRVECIALSNDGSTFAAFTPMDYSLSVYSFQDNIWKLKGNGIPKTWARATLGNNISLSSNGNTLAFGNFENIDSEGPEEIRVYTFQNDQWVQLGNTIESSVIHDMFGFNTEISANGRIIATSNPKGKYARVYELKNDLWQQRGFDFNADSDSFLIGDIALNADGSVFAFAQYHGDSTIGSEGKINVFKWRSSAWENYGSTIHGESLFDRAGNSLNLSVDGSSILIAAPRNQGFFGDGPPAGHMRVFYYGYPLGLSKQYAENFSLWPNPANDIIHVEASSNEIRLIKVYTLLGELLMISEFSEDIDISILPSGHYLLEGNGELNCIVFKTIFIKT